MLTIFDTRSSLRCARIRRRKTSGGRVELKQHIVSKCYLKAWCDPATPKGHEPYIWLISRDGLSKVKRAPHKSLTRSDAYTVVFNDGKRDLRVETTLSQLEGKFVRVREKIVGGKYLDDFDRAYLAAFMATMHSRTDPIEKGMKRFTEEIDLRVREMEETIRTKGVRHVPPRISPACEGAPITSEDTAYLVRNGLPIFVETALRTAAPVMFGMSMAFLVAPNGSFFVTSDNPCVWFDPTAYKRHPFYRSVGLAMKDIEITMPICPELLAIMTHDTKARGYLNLDEEQTNEFNRRTVAFSDSFRILRRRCRSGLSQARLLRMRGRTKLTKKNPAIHWRSEHARFLPQFLATAAAAFSTVIRAYRSPSSAFTAAPLSERTSVLPQEPSAKARRATRCCGFRRR